MLIAITRSVSASLADCELTYRVREPIDVGRAVEQHAAYERTLASQGAGIVRVPGDPELPDAVFIEDTALALDEVAVITRPGAASRRLETDPLRGNWQATGLCFTSKLLRRWTGVMLCESTALSMSGSLRAPIRKG